MKFDTLTIAMSEGGTLPVRGAWIEIPPGSKQVPRGEVAPRKGSVD